MILCEDCNKPIVGRIIRNRCIPCYKAKWYLDNRERESQKKKDKYISKKKPQRYCAICNAPVRYNAKGNLCAIHSYEKRYTEQNKRRKAEKAKYYIAHKDKYNADRGFYNRYGYNRVELFKFLGGACSSCGSTHSLQLHHKDKQGLNKPVAQRNNKITNLQLLCIACHAEHHRRDIGFGKLRKV